MYAIRSYYAAVIDGPLPDSKENIVEGIADQQNTKKYFDRF